MAEDMGENGTSDEGDRIDRDRRRALALLGLWAAAAYLAPALIISRPAKAQGDGGGDDDDDGHGDDDDDHDDDEGGDSDSGSLQVPPEAPYQERRRGSRKARK